jgi:hypothetical protein
MAEIDARRVLPVAIAIALLLALWGLTSWFVLPALASRSGQPVLDERQLMALATYKRRCRVQADCETPLLCMGDARLGGWRCLANECESDLQCESGFMCATFKYSDTPAIHLCVIRGERKEGERCAEFPVHEKHGCQPGLLCNSGFCGRPCRPDGPPACPEGFACHPGTNEPACLPSCLRTGCPPERQCVRMSGDYAICAVVHGHDCEKQPCSPGEVCRRILTHLREPQTVNMECALPCGGKDGERCPQGTACVSHYCERTCDEGAPGSCHPGERCARVIGPKGRLAICELDQ